METKDTLSLCSNSEEQQMQQIQDKAKKSCMVSFRQLHSHLKLLSNNDLKGTRTESGFKRAFATLFGQDIETFTGTMFLYVDQLEKQLDKEEFQEIGSMASFKVLETQFQMFIKSRMYLDDEFVVMTRNYFLQYTQLAIPEFRDTLIQHMESVKKSIDERAKHKEEYNSWVNERQMQTTEDKVDSSKAVDASLVNTESIGTESKEQDTSSRSGNDAHADDADIRPIYDEEPMAENVEQCHDTYPLPAKLTDNQTTELLNQSLESKNIRLKKTVAQFQKDFLRMETHCVNLELKYQNQALKEGQHGQFLEVKSNEVKVKHDIDVIETINIELKYKVAKLLKENESLKKHYKELSDSIKTARAKTIEHTTSLIAQNADFKAKLQEKGFAIAALKNELRKLTGNIDVNNDLSKPVTAHYLPKERESAIAKPHHMIAPGSSRYNLNDMVHNHYLEEAKKKTQRNAVVNSEPSVMPSVRSQSIANDSKPKPRINNQRWVPTGKIFTFSTTKVDSEPPHGSNTDITNLHECKQTLYSSAGTSINVPEEQNLDLNACTPFNLKKKRIKVCIKENVISGRPRIHGTTWIQEISARPKGSYALSWKPCQGGSLNLPDHRHKRRCSSLIPAESNSLPHAHAQTIKTYYKHQDSRIKKAQEFKTKTSANSDIQDLPLRYQVYQGRLLVSFQDDA
ncbi:hypothetical protein Tco_0450789 [Tanacetum coccineum]